MKPENNIKKFFGKAAVDTNPKTDKTKLNKILAAQTKASIWRLIMESPVTKLAAVTVVIIAISLSLIPFNNSISSSAYAFEQTIEANNSIHNLHILMSRSKGNKYLSVEIWAMCDNNGKATNLRAEISDDISEDDNQLRYFTWNDGILEIWWPSRNALYVCRTNENEIERYWQQLVNEYNPRVLYQY